MTNDTNNAAEATAVDARINTYDTQHGPVHQQVLSALITVMPFVHVLRQYIVSIVNLH